MRYRTPKELERLSAIITMTAPKDDLDPEGSAGQLPVAPIPAQSAPERRNMTEERGRFPRHSGTPLEWSL